MSLDTSGLQDEKRDEDPDVRETIGTHGLGIEFNNPFFLDAARAQSEFVKRMRIWVEQMNNMQEEAEKERRKLQLEPEMALDALGKMTADIIEPHIVANWDQFNLIENFGAGVGIGLAAELFFETFDSDKPLQDYLKTLPFATDAINDQLSDASNNLVDDYVFPTKLSDIEGIAVTSIEFNLNALEPTISATILTVFRPLRGIFPEPSIWLDVRLEFLIETTRPANCN